MSEIQTVELTKEERDLLLRGLRFVRSSVLLDMRTVGPEIDSDRANKLHEVEALADHLSGSQMASAPANV